LSDRLRGRARAAARGTAPEGLAAEGRRGHAAVVRLRGVRGALLARRGTRRSRRSSRGLGARVAGVGRRGGPEGLSGDGRRGAVPARGSGSARVPAESVPDRQGAVRAEVRAQRPSRLGAHSAARPGGAGVRRTRMQKPKLVPSSTYRLQVHRGFTLHAARDVVPYLRRLGAGAAYTSPYFAAEPESTHGYDVTNHNEISEQVGGEAAHAAFTDALRDAGLQHIVDFVPNHMGISTATNPWWRDVLAHGPRSESARFFDIDWNPFKSELRRKLLLPILGDQYGKVLERGELQVELNGEAEAGTAGVVLRYFDSRLPLTIPRRFDREEIERLNGIPGQPRSFDALHELLEAQAYRLAYWRTAAHEINYRRFFDINTLAGLRVEDPVVFEAIHRRLARLLADGRVTGLRIDHPDGLFDPAKYFEMLQTLAGGVWIVAEKILSGRERLPARWPVHGTTGYNFLNQVNGLFVDPSSAR